MIQLDGQQIEYLKEKQMVREEYWLLLQSVNNKYNFIFTRSKINGLQHLEANSFKITVVS
jgi:hypothetical protein